jgi:ABC-type branched-subunit amino acid transport system permease subunit
MIATNLRNGVRTGITFAVVIIFLVLIGFTITGAALVAKVFGIQVAPNTLPDVSMLAVFLGLIGFFAGTTAARPRDHDLFIGAVISGLAAGLACGLISAVFAYVLSTLYAGGVDMRNYLSSVSPDSVKYLVFNQEPLSGSLVLFGLLTACSLLGGFVARIYRSEGRRAFFARINQGWSSVLGQSFMKRIRSSRWARYLLFGLVLLLLAFLPAQWGTYWNYVMGTVGIYIIMGLGLNIIVGLAGQLVLGYVAFFAIGAYTVAILNAPLPHNLMWGFWIAVFLAIVFSALAGVLVGLPILSLRGDYLAIVTLGLGEIMRILLKSDAATPLFGGPAGIQNIAGPIIFGKTFSTDVDFMYMIIIGVLLAVFITQRIQNSRTGRAWVSIREDETVSKATGVDTFRSKLLALALGAAFAGMGGALFAVRNQFTGPEDHVLMVSINVLALVIVGGMGSIPGVILGAFVLKGLPEILRELENYRLLVFAALLVVMMIIRPEGIWPARRPNLEKQGNLELEKTPEEMAAEPVKEDPV